MHITRLRIRNFRSIGFLDLPLEKTTVLIGPNNSGKTAILEALRIALTRRWGQRGTGFTEYDCRLEQDDSDPKDAPPIEIEVELSESEAGDWGEDLQADLEDLLQIDPTTARATIIMKVSCSWSETEESYVPKWEFLNSERKPLVGKAAKLVNMNRFFEYIPVFYLDALRDADDEFSSRSQFWGRLLRSVNIPKNLAHRSQQVFDRLNRRLLVADPKVANIAAKLEGIGDVAAEDAPGAVNIRMVPLKTWDLLSRAQVILKTTDKHPWLPLARHGRGVQSLSVMFLFQAFVDELLRDLFHPDTAPFLALEEPETHLHPQAARTLWRHVNALSGQKIVTTHSPYFVQHVPFRDLRLIRTTNKGTTFNSLPSFFDAELPHIAPLDAFIALRSANLSYDRSTRRLVVKGAMIDSHYRDLIIMYAGHVDKASIYATLKDLNSRSQHYVPDSVLSDLDEYARRIRGEIFFSRRWLLVEGQSDYILAHAIGEALGYPLDAYGVSVIDCVNHGTPQSFAMLARGLGIPWIAVFDNDKAGLGYIATIKARGFDEAETAKRCKLFTSGDLEQQLLAQGNALLMREIATELGIKDVATLDDTKIIEVIKKHHKVACAVALSSRLNVNPALVASMPDALVAAISALRTLD